MRKVALILTLPALLMVYAGVIEPNWLEVTNHKSTHIVDAPLVIAHITDLHLKQFGALERKVLKIVYAEKPDVIFITGDQCDTIDCYPALSTFLRSLKAPLGVWVTLGNWEHWLPPIDHAKYYETNGTTLLMNKSVLIRKDISVTGFDDASSGTPQSFEAEREISAARTKICLFHSPSFFETPALECDLALAGHTHGGQVRLPFLSPFWMPTGSGRFVAGWYFKGKSKMYVSRGVGTSIFPIRFMSRPEVAIIRLEPK